jgi:hypothetical protein
LVIKALDPYWIRIRIRIRIGLQRQTLDPDPDPEKMNTDPQHWSSSMLSYHSASLKFEAFINEASSF